MGWKPFLEIEASVRGNSCLSQGRTSFAKRGDSTFCAAGQAAAAVAGSGGGLTMKVWGQCTIVRPARGERG